MEKFVPSDLLQDQAQSTMDALVDFTDVTGIVSLIAVPFSESSSIDESTIPASANFAPLTSSTAPTIIATPGTGIRSLLWDDPTGGWDFVSIGTGFPLTFYGYRVDATGGNFLGCKTMTPITITAAGQHIVLGIIRLPIDGKVFAGN